MTTRRIRVQDLIAVCIAGLGTVALLSVELPSEPVQSSAAGQIEPALAELLTAELAAREGELLLEQPSAKVELSFAPDHDRLVWRVQGHDRAVVLDARTGEALAFEFG